MAVVGANGERVDERLLNRRFAALDDAYFKRLPKRAQRLVRERAPFESVSAALRECGWDTLLEQPFAESYPRVLLLCRKRTCAGS